jgi:glycosyltransferase involved in cell wall biosynthesis
MPETRKTKIIRVIARLNVGGPAKHVAWLTAGLQNSSYHSLLVTGSVPGGEEDMGYFAESLGVVPFPIREMSREISPKDVVTVWKLLRLFMRERPDIVHTHTAKAGTVGRIAGFIYRWLTPGIFVRRPVECKFVHTYHGHVFHSYYGPLKTKVFIGIERLLARAVTDRIFVVSEQQRDEIKQRFGVGKANQFRVVPLGLDLKVFSSPDSRRHLVRQELGVDDETLLIGIVGRLVEVKNHELFLKAAARFSEQSTKRKVRFVVIGDGSLRQSLETMSLSLGLENKVIFAGSRRDPENFYAALDAVALTSLNEGTPLTLIEAMANARPVIATKVGGIVDLLGDEEQQDGYTVCCRGITVPSGDVDAFAAGLTRLAEDVELRERLGMNGLEFVSHNYSKDRLLTDIIELYEELLRTTTATVKSQSPERSLQSRA